MMVIIFEEWRFGSSAFSRSKYNKYPYKLNLLFFRIGIRTSRSKTVPPTRTRGHWRNPTTFQHFLRRRPVRNLDSKTRPEELCSRGEILLCDIPTFTEETLELAKRFSCDFDGRCDI